MSDAPAKTNTCLKQIIGFGLVIDIIVIDQMSKWMMLEYIFKPMVSNREPLGLIDWIMAAPPRTPPASIEILPFFNLTMVWNEGISFGLLKGDMPLILIGLSLLITGLFSYWLVRAKSWWQAISLAMVIGGAIGNVIDRARFGAVADFLDFHIAGWHYPAFNIADMAITLGIAILVFDGLFLEPKRNKV